MTAAFPNIQLWKHTTMKISELLTVQYFNNFKSFRVVLNSFGVVEQWKWNVFAFNQRTFITRLYPKSILMTVGRNLFHSLRTRNQKFTQTTSRKVSKDLASSLAGNNFCQAALIGNGIQKFFLLSWNVAAPPLWSRYKVRQQKSDDHCPQTKAITSSQLFQM